MSPALFWAMLVSSALYAISLALLYDCLFERRLGQFWHWTCLIAAGLLLHLVFLLLPAGTSILRVLSYIFVNCCIAGLFRGKLMVRLCISVLYYFIATALETILLPTLLLFTGMPLDQLLDNPVLAVLVYLLPMVILSVSRLFLSRVFRSWNSQIELPALEWLAIFLFAVFTLCELYFASVLIQTNSAYIPWLPVLGFVLLFMNAGLLLLLNKLALTHRMAQENLALQDQMRYNRLRLQATAESYDAQRSLTHDFNNHLLTIAQLLQSEQSRQALDYAQTILDRVGKAEVAVSTNNPIADAVLNQKYRKAQELGVQMQFLVSDLSAFPLSADEMVTVLANLLDNALEACTRDGATQKKSIRVKLLMEPSLATLSVQNTSLPVAVSQTGQVPSSKENQAEHGYGLTNCKKILQRSGFDFAVQYKDGWFQFTAIQALS